MHTCFHDLTGSVAPFLSLFPFVRHRLNIFEYCIRHGSKLGADEARLIDVRVCVCVTRVFVVSQEIRV